MERKSLPLNAIVGIFILMILFPCNRAQARNEATPVTPVGRVYTVKTAAELKWVANQVNATDTYSFLGDTILLAADIDLLDYEWEPIGQYHTRKNSFGYAIQRPFSGYFDGRGHVVRNLNTTFGVDIVQYAAGLFGYVNGSSTIRAVVCNLGIDNFYMKVDAVPRGVYFISGGLLIGRVQNAVIENCYVENSAIEASVIHYSNYFGGIIGNSSVPIRNCFIRNSSIDCFTSGDMEDTGSVPFVGGIAGVAYAKISDCYSEGTTIRGNVPYMGGIVGSISTYTVENCFVTGHIIAEGDMHIASTGNYVSEAFVGGIAGRAPNVRNCYMTGDITWNSILPEQYYGDQLKYAYVHIGGIAGYPTTGGTGNNYVTGEIKIIRKEHAKDYFYVGGLVGSGGSSSFGHFIKNNVFAGKLTGDSHERIIRGSIIGHYNSIFLYAEKSISYNYFTETGYNAIGTTETEANIQANNYIVEPARLLEKDFWWNSKTWDYEESSSSNFYWPLKPYYYEDGKMPQLRHLVRSYTADKWDGISYLMAPTPSDSILVIGNPAELAWLANEVNNGVTYAGRTIELKNDIDLGGHYWPVIANGAEALSYNTVFRGNFDGKGHAVSNYELHNYLSRGSNANSVTIRLGLFGEIRGKSEIRNLKLDNCRIILSNEYTHDITGNYRNIYAGALAGQTNDSLVSITNCHAINLEITSDPTVPSRHYYIGGLIGTMNHGGVVDGCSAELDASVFNPSTSQECALGGLIGQVYASDTRRLAIRNSWVKPAIMGNIRYTGGLIGYVTTYSYHIIPTIEDCFVSEGSVEGTFASGRVGGFAGQLFASSEALLQRCYSLASVEGYCNIGGFIGESGAPKLDINQCFARGDVTRIESEAKNGVYNVGAFIGRNNAIVRNCYATGAVSSVDQLENFGYLGGFIGDSGSRNAVQNCYATGKVEAPESQTGTKYLGAFSGGALVNVWNCFSDSHVSEEGTPTIHFNGAFGENYNNPIFAYIPYEGKKYGIYTPSSNFRDPAFFTDTNNWRDTTVMVGSPAIPITTTGWDNTIWFYEDGYYPILKNLDREPQQHEPVSIDSPSIKGNMYAYTQDGLLHIEGLKPGESYVVYNIQGIKVDSGQAMGSRVSVGLNTRGVYIIATQHERIKVRY